MKTGGARLSFEMKFDKGSGDIHRQIKGASTEQNVNAECCMCTMRNQMRYASHLKYGNNVRDRLHALINTVHDSGKLAGLIRLWPVVVR